jgi:hypothetical protein
LTIRRFAERAHGKEGILGSGKVDGGGSPGRVAHRNIEILKMRIFQEGISAFLFRGLLSKK